MNKIYRILSIAFVISNFSSCKEEKKQSCEIKEIRTLFTTVGIHDKDTAYGHYILVADFPRKCIDSTKLVNLALTYIDTVTTAKPVDVVMFFNSDKEFIPNSVSQDLNKINKNCLVVIGFDEKSNTPNDFIFYNHEGKRVYWGNRWLPSGE